MGAFEDFLKKQGYVKLDRYGLVLTPDDRILSTRPAVLDDGLGGKIVGWSDGDLAAAELEQWGAPAKKAPAPKPAAAKPVAANGGVQVAAPTRPSRPLPGVAPMTALPGVAPMTTLPGVAPIAAPMVAAPIAAPLAPPARMPAATIPPPIAAMPAPVTQASQVAAEPVVEEDEWEWEIAMARARAAGDDVVSAGAMAASSFTAPKKPAAKPAPAPAKLAAGSGPISAAATSLAAAAAATKSDPMSQWPVTEPLHESWGEETRESPAPQVMSPAAKTLAVAKSEVRAMTPPRGRSTVIPVPSLPVAAKPSDVRPAFNPGQPPPRLASRPRSGAQAQGQQRSRLARGTATVHNEDTVVTAPVLPANDDHTSPYVTLPAEVKPAPGFAHTKQVAAKHR